MKDSDKARKIFLIVINIVLVFFVMLSAINYSNESLKREKNTKTNNFVQTVETMKRITLNNIESEKGFVNDWAKYIEEKNMNLEEALSFLRQMNTNTERFAHIVDMDTFEAYSSFYPSGQETIDTYKKIHDSSSSFSKLLIHQMQESFEAEESKSMLFGKYQIAEIHAMGVSVGTRVSLQTPEGKKDYFLLRIIPSESIKKIWVFPTEYSSAEIGVITRNGDYVIQSASLRSETFLDYIRGYNFENNYNEVNNLKEILQTTDEGIFHYQNYKHKDCFWYYSLLNEDSNQFIVGFIEEKELSAESTALVVVSIICGSLIFLTIIDGFYFSLINRKLKKAVLLANEASKAKTNFLSSMSHDIRTPMNVMVGMQTLAYKHANEEESVKMYLEKSLSASRQMLTLVNDILDISKIESGKLVLNNVNVSLCKIADSLDDFIHSYAISKEIEVIAHFENLDNKYVFADETRMNQIFINLLSNAVKYTNRNGKIEYSLLLEEGKEKDLLTFIVKDNGIGMSKEYQKIMYNSFSREVDTKINRTQGTGLGLAIVKQVVDLFHGTIDCESEENVGTTFTVKLELEKGKEVDTKQEKDIEKTDYVHSGKLRLLVAEDNNLNWEIIHTILDGEGIENERAENGKICIEKLTQGNKKTYDAILMDIQMPELNGIEATKQIRKLTDKKAREIPIIAMTADAFAEDIHKCLDAGMDEHVSKPIDIDRLFDCLNKVISDRKGRGI